MQFNSAQGVASRHCPLLQRCAVFASRVGECCKDFAGGALSEHLLSLAIKPAQGGFGFLREDRRGGSLGEGL